VNPPFSDLGRWTAKAVEERGKGRTVAMLLPTNTLYWRTNVLRKAKCLLLLTDRIKFDEYKRPAPMPLCLAVFVGKGQDPKRKRDLMKKLAESGKQGPYKWAVMKKIK
jgi:hypothetical protein